MIYQKNKNAELDVKLFENPTKEYRGAPFWAWNTTLDKDELLWQIEQLKKMGFGGFHIHVRSGMATKYLSEEFMELVKACLEKGKQEDMLVWLYDEDRWPSGSAGGYVTSDKRLRMKMLVLTECEESCAVDEKTGIEEAKPYYLTKYDVVVDKDGKLKSYKRITNERAPIEGKLYYAYVWMYRPTGWFNGTTYLDTLSKRAVEKFADITHNAYKREVGRDFGHTIPAIFTDEPQHSEKIIISNSPDNMYANIPWTVDFEESFSKKYGYSILDKIPEVVWDLPGNRPSQVRYHYHNHVTDLFSEAYAGTLGAWCDENGICLSGHLMEEPTLSGQTKYVGEAMRSYPKFGIPGMDLLCNRMELSTAKQVQSVVHQYGKEGMISELYGVTGWDFDFRGHKFQGDWQAGLGVTVRVPHLSWVSMKGSAKRDYPASIHYQSAWYQQYGYVEDHFARINTVMTRGKPIVKVGVVHPIESFFMAFGANRTTGAVQSAMEERFRNTIRWLLGGFVDFDFISESLLPDIYERTEDALLKVGEMEYETVLVPPLTTMRETTVRILTDYVQRGGNLIFAGEAPECMDGAISALPKRLYESAKRCVFGQTEILELLQANTELSVTNENGMPATNFVHSLRQDGQKRWFFMARSEMTDKERFGNDNPQKLRISFKGAWRPEVFDTVNGKIKAVPFRVKNGKTEIPYDLYAYDSLLLRLSPTFDGDSYQEEKKEERIVAKRIDFKEKVSYTLSEPNVLVLDVGSLSWDKQVWEEREEMLRMDKKISEKFSWPMADGNDCQPWAIEEEKPNKFPYVKFVIQSEVEAECSLAFEEATEIEWNGEAVNVRPDGYFVDKAIKTTALPRLKKGENVLIVRMPISKRVSMENLFLLGNFGVSVDGTCAKITKLPEKIAFGNITEQGFPFYGGEITYVLPIDTPDGALRVQASLYRGALITAKLDGEEIGKIAYAPYILDIENVRSGKHVLELTLYATRVNSFNALHDCCTSREWKGPDMYYTQGTSWSYEYNLRPVGILKSPVLEVVKKH